MTTTVIHARTTVEPTGAGRAEVVAVSRWGSRGEPTLLHDDVHPA